MCLLSLVCLLFHCETFCGITSLQNRSKVLIVGSLFWWKVFEFDMMLIVTCLIPSFLPSKRSQYGLLIMEMEWILSTLQHAVWNIVIFDFHYEMRNLYPIVVNGLVLFPFFVVNSFEKSTNIIPISVLSLKNIT